MPPFWSPEGLPFWNRPAIGSKTAGPEAVRPDPGLSTGRRKHSNSVAAPGTLVEFFQDRKILCGLCLKSDKKGMHVLSEENREVGLPDSRVLLTVPNFFDPGNLREHVVERLRMAAERREAFRRDINLGDLWELLQEERRKYTHEELAQTWFGGDVQVEQISAMMRALRDDRVFFERKGDDYVPNTQEHVSTVQQSLRAEAEKETERAEMTRWFQQLWLGSRATPPACADKYLRYLKDCVVLGAEAPRFKEMAELLRRAQISQNDAPFQLLVKAGIWDEDENVLLHKHQITAQFPQAVEAEADALLAQFRQSDAWREGRQDLRHLHCYTVDDEDTTEMDDALSFESLGDGVYRIGIHIADAAQFVQPGSAIDREALHRATSVYFADAKFRMLPNQLSDVICSLKQGDDRPAVSILVTLDDEATILASDIVESVIHVGERLDYHGVNRTYEDVVALKEMIRLAGLRKAIRLRHGAMHIPFRKVEVHVSKDKKVSIEREDATTPSHTMVSEFMILANHTVAEMCVEKGIPAVYRIQDPPSEPLQIPETFGPLDAYKIRRFLKKGDQSTTVARHHGLGVDAYVQFTSPIRRYIDLVMHRQIKHYLKTGEALIAKTELDQIMATCSGPLEVAELLERTRRNYWIMKYLENNLWQSREAHVLQVFHDRYIVQLDDCLLFADCQPRGDGKHPQPGDVIHVRIEMVWPRDGVVRLSVDG